VNSHPDSFISTFETSTLTEKGIKRKIGQTNVEEINEMKLSTHQKIISLS